MCKGYMEIHANTVHMQKQSYKATPAYRLSGTSKVVIMVSIAGTELFPGTLEVA